MRSVAARRPPTERRSSVSPMRERCRRPRWLSRPRCSALFLVSGGLIGAGAGAVFKGTTGLVLDGTAPENRVAMTAELLIALFVGLSVPVIGAGVALDRGASASNTVLGFAIFVALGVAAAGRGLLAGR